MKGVQIRFTPELIRETLDLDESYDIIDATFDPIARQVIFIVTGPDLPELQEGTPYPHGHIEDIGDAPAPRKRRHIIPD